MNKILIDIVKSYSFKLLQWGVKALVNSGILKEIRETVISLLNEDLTNDQKRAAVVQVARDTEVKLIEIINPLPTALLEIAISVIVMEVKANLGIKNAVSTNN